MIQPRVSIIIPVYNEEKYIQKCLESLIVQSYNNLEIIVINDGSTDKTLGIIKQVTEKNKKLKFFSTDHLGTAKARNFAAKKSNGEILVFVDADMHADKDFVKDLTKPIIQGKSKGTFTKLEYVANQDNKWAVSWNIEYSQNKKRRIPKKSPNKSHVFRAILKTEFEKVGGYDLISYMQDWTLSKKLGYKSTVVSGAKLYHFNPETVLEVFYQAKWVATRKYKLGEIGRFIALVRATFPFSLIFGITRSIKHKFGFYLIFKILYDFGLFVGIITYWIDHRSAQ